MVKKKFAIDEPTIISAPVIYWKPSSKSKRDGIIKWRHNQVYSYLKKIGFNPVTSNTTTTASLTQNKLGEIKVVFSYEETNKNVYKHFEVYRNGVKSNIQTLRKLYP